MSLQKTIRTLHIFFALEKILFFLINFCLILNLPLWLVILPAFLPNILLVIVALLITLPILTFLIFRQLSPHSFNQHKLISTMEISIFKKQLFILTDFLKQPSIKVEHYYHIDSLTKNYLHSILPKKILQIFLVLLLTGFQTFGIFTAGDTLSKRIKQVQKFYALNPLKNLPKHYAPGKSLKITLSHPLISSYSVQISNTLIIAPGKTLVIPPKDTSTQKLTLIVHIFYAGFSRRFLWTPHAMLPFSLRSTKITLYTPLGIEQYSGIRDLDVWFHSTIDILLTLSSKVGKIEGLKHGLSVQIKNKTVRIYGRIRQSFAEHIRIISKQGQILALPDFHIKIKQNQSPTLKLLFPLQPVPLLGFPWNVHVVLQAEDDLGLKDYSLCLLVSNRDPAIARENSSSNFTRFPLTPSSSLQITPLLQSQDFILLPDDVIQAEYTVRDLLGKSSKPVQVTLIYPDSETRENLREKQRSDLIHKLDILSNHIAQNQQHPENLSSWKTIKQDSKNLLQSESSFQKLSSNTEMNEIRGKLKKLDEITQSLTKNLETLSELAKLNPEKATLEQKKQISLNIDRLEELRELLHQLETLQKSTDWLKALRESKALFDRLNQNPSRFETTLKKYQNSLKKLEQKVPNSLKNGVQNLFNQSKKLKQNDPKSLESSQKEWKNLEKQSQEALQKIFENKQKQNVNLITALIEESFLRQLVYEKTTKSINLQNEVDRIQALNRSTHTSAKDIHNLLNNIFPDSVTRRQLIELSEQQNKLLKNTLTAFRDHQMSLVRRALFSAASINARLFITLLNLNQILTSKSQKSGQSSKTTSLSLQDLMQMQQSLSHSLQKLLQKKQGLNPSDRETLKKLSDLQSKIRKSLENILRKNGQQTLSGGNEIGKMMDDLQKQLKSYRITAKTLEKSRRIEEKLKKGQKSLKNKGLSQERKSEQGHSYEVSPPPKLHIQTLPKQNLKNIPNNHLPSYYRSLIKKILDLNETNR